MATGTAISVEEYLRTSYEPNCEYIDGVLVPKAMGTKKHGKLQTHLGTILELAFPQYETCAELTVRIDGKRYLIPDIAVERREEAQDPYPILPIHLCIEILSPEDRLSELWAKCEIYHAWGTQFVWMIDPVARRAWEYTKGTAPREVLELTAGDIHLTVEQIFAGI